ALLGVEMSERVHLRRDGAKLVIRKREQAGMIRLRDEPKRRRSLGTPPSRDGSPVLPVERVSRPAGENWIGLGLVGHGWFAVGGTHHSAPLRPALCHSEPPWASRI